MLRSDLPAIPPPPHCQQARAGDRVLIITPHGLLRAMTVKYRRGHRVVLDDGSLYYRKSGDNSITTYGDGPHPGSIHQWDDRLNADQINAEFAAWHNEHQVAEAKREERHALARQIRHAARRMSVNFQLADLPALQLTSILNRLNDLNQAVGA